MAFGGREIKSFLTLDITNFTQGLSGAKSKAASLQSELNGLQKGASGSNSEVSKLKQNSDGLNQTMNNLSQTTSKTGKELENTAKSTSNAGNNATAAQSKMSGLNSAMNLLKATAGMLAITLGMDLAMQIMNVANSAVNAQGQIAGMARGMGWDSSQLTAYTNEMARLQTIYRKTDMNQVGMEVAKMARIYKLNASEAKDLIETSAVFSSAMAMEGRSARDSALALKDLIDQGQGWERRLSEIGVTADALKATGLWSGDKEDKKGIIAALNQVLEQRSLTQMAKEINSLDDAVQVLTIAGGQLLGAFLIPAAPLIYAITMALADLAYGAKNVIGWLSSSWAALPGWVQLGIIIGIASIALTTFGLILVGSLIPALTVKIAKIVTATASLFGYDIAQKMATASSAGFGRTILFSLQSLVAFIAGESLATVSTWSLTTALWMMTKALVTNPIVLATAALIVLAVAIYKVGEYFKWWKDIPTMIEAIKSGVMRLWAAFTNNPHVVATINGIKEAWEGLVSFIVPLWNNLFPSDNGSFDIIRSIIDLFGLLGDALQPVGAIFFWLGSTVVNVLSWIGNAVVRLWDFFQNNPLGQVLALLTYFVNPLLFIVLNFNKLVWVVTQAGNAIKAFFGAFFDSEGRFVGLIQGFQNAFGMLWNWLLSIDWGAVATGFVTAIYNSVKGLGQYIWNALFGGLENVSLEGILYGILSQIIIFFANYNPVTMMIRLLLGDTVANQFVIGIRSILFPALNALMNFIGILRGVAGYLWGVLSPIGSALSWIGGLILNGAWQVLIGYWNTLVSVGQFLYSIFTSLTGAWDALVGAFFKDGEWQGIIPGLQNLGGMIWNAIVNIDWIGLGVFFWNSLMGIFSAGGDIIGQFMSWLVNVDWIGLFMAIGEWLIQFNPIGVLIGYIFGGDGGGGLLEAITLWASGIDWYGILMAMFQFIAQYNPLTMIVTLLFGDAAGQTFSTMLMNIFIFAAQGLMIGIQVIMGVINILASFIGSTWSTIQSTTQWIWNNVFMTIWNIMNQIWGAVSPYVGMILSAWNQMKNGMLSAAVAIRDGVWGPISTLYDKLKEFWSFITGGGSRGSGGGGGGFGGTTWPGAAGGPDISVLNYSGGLSNDGLFAGIAPMVFRSTQNRMYGAGPAPENDDTCYYDGNCYAGGWDFSDNWIDRILSTVYGWKMNIGGVSLSLSTLKNGGSLSAFAALASSIIGRTAYQFYYGDQKSNAQALRDRRFNCFDGAQIIIALAQAMGLSAYMAHGTWGSTGIPHVWAMVNGIPFDTTAFQNRGTWSPPPGSGAGGFGIANPVKRVLHFVFNITGPIYDKDGLIKEIKNVVHEELNGVVDELFD
ncbi:hypothetical protein [Methanobacterium formicicum]|uniref:Uncharacterized protein n=1 Tax=Methanobacterium formicicum TaxID=2162 RepID=A0A090I1P1_METFO|nr:hypothetical protein [Methanobacterium formicicum]MDH2659722.1 hypothetical protein [Methanobacterium formicicum]CEA12754.1 hypothetical protein DSM1535_0391 [Methanobacterium formicicum]